jgi:uncharacterized protein YdaU (DUF1376 family)
MAKGDYYFPLYYKRLLTSTIGWKDDEFGAYIRLLIHQFDNNNSIPDDLEELALIAPSVKKNWKRLQKKFKKNDAGELFNEVMKDVFDDVQRKKNIRSEIGKTGGRPKKQLVNQTETNNKPKGFDLLKQNESYPITNNQEPIINTVLNTPNTKTVVANSAGEIPPLASTTTDFVNERHEKIYEMFKRVSTWNAEIIMLEVSRFMNKYPTVPLNQCGALINTWAANYKPALQTNQASVSAATIADEIYQARKREDANEH